MLLDELDGSEPLRHLRAIEVLERINDKQARELLRRLSEGAAGAWLTEEARTTPLRLKQRKRRARRLTMRQQHYTMAMSE